MMVSSATSFMWTAISSLLVSLKGFPRCSNDDSTFKTSFPNAACVCSCCWYFSAVTESPDSLVIRATSGPLTIHLPSAAGFSVSPTAPPSPLTSEFSCSWAWSRAMDENSLDSSSQCPLNKITFSSPGPLMSLSQWGHSSKIFLLMI